METLASLESEVRFFGLHVIRVLAMAAVLPFFGTAGAGRLLKIGLSVLLGTSIAFASDRSAFADPGFTSALALLAAKEALLGLLLGFVLGLVLQMTRSAAQIIAQEMGFSFSNVVDPVFGVSSMLLSTLFETVALLLLFGADAHHRALRALALSFRAVPVGDLPRLHGLFDSLAAVSGGFVVAALQLAAPVFMTLAIVSVSLAVLAKVAPQFHIMDTAFPIRIAAGFAALAVFMPILMPSVHRLFAWTEERALALVGAR